MGNENKYGTGTWLQKTFAWLFFSAVLLLALSLLGFMVYVVKSSKDYRMALANSELQDRADFEKVFEIDPLPFLPLDNLTEAEKLSWNKKNLKVKAKLLDLAYGLVYQTEDMARLRDVDQNTDVTKRASEISALEKEMSVKKADFVQHLKLALRFAHTIEFEEAQDELSRPYKPLRL